MSIMTCILDQVYKINCLLLKGFYLGSSGANCAGQVGLNGLGV